MTIDVVKPTDPPQQTGHHQNKIDVIDGKKNQAGMGRSQHTSPGNADSTQGTLPIQQYGGSRGGGARGRPTAQAPTLRAHAQSEDIAFAHARRGRASRVSFHPLC